MYKYIDFFKYYEADRTRFISKNPNLTDEQKQEIIDTFKKFPAIDKDIKWGSNEVNNWTYDQFKPYLDRAKLSKKQSLKNGLEGLVEGQDYRIVKQYEDGTTSYEILTHKASAVIASNQVAPEVWTPMPYWNRNEDVMSLRVLPFGKPKNLKIKKANSRTLFPGAKWCTAMQTSDRYWNQYTEEGIRFVYIVSPNQEETGNKKIALAWKGENNYKVFDAYDEDISNTGGSFISSKVFVYIKDAIQWLMGNKPPKKDYIKLGVLVLNKETGRYDCEDTEKIKVGNLIENGKFKYPLGIWNGDFDCSETDLTSLEGAPTEVKGYFYCSYCENLISLEGAPQIVENGFYCKSCNNLKSLKGAPNTVKGHFDCSWCLNLKSLTGAPNIVDRNFYCNHCKNLTSLDDAPTTIEGSFYCDSCNNLTSLEGAPQIVGGSFDCSWCNNLTSLGGAPQKVGGYFDCSNCWKLTSLEGAPQIANSFSCNNCKKLTSLEGAPIMIDGSFRCNNCNNLTSLAGAPKIVKGTFNCSNCINLTSLEGAPSTVGKGFYCEGCNKLTSLEGFNTRIIGSFYANKELEEMYYPH